MGKSKKRRSLSRSQSEHTDGRARITRLAFDVFGDLGKVRRWLENPNRALGGAIPLVMLKSRIGIRKVEEILLRIVHGIYS